MMGRDALENAVRPSRPFTSTGSNRRPAPIIGASNDLHLEGDDGFVDVVALHEPGHHVQEYSDSNSPGEIDLVELIDGCFEHDSTAGACP